AELRIGRPQIREVFLRNGARIEPDRDDLPDWIYESASELLELAAPDVADALASMTCAYRMAIQAGHTRITALGGDCDSVDHMLANFPGYRKAVELHKAHRSRGGE